jgi:hypothetical protein
MTSKVTSTHNLDTLTNDERVVVAAGREAWNAITKTFDTWCTLGKAIVTLRRKADAIGGRDTFLRLLDQNGLSQIDEGEISRLKRIMAHIEEVRTWHSSLGSLNKQIAWSSPSSVIRHCPIFAKPKEPKAPTFTPSAAAKASELEAAEARVVELDEELATARAAKPMAMTAEAIVEWIVANVSAKVQKKIVEMLTTPKPPKKAKASAEWQWPSQQALQGSRSKAKAPKKEPTPTEKLNRVVDNVMGSI